MCFYFTLFICVAKNLTIHKRWWPFQYRTGLWIHVWSFDICVIFSIIRRIRSSVWCRCGIGVNKPIMCILSRLAQEVTCSALCNKGWLSNLVYCYENLLALLWTLNKIGDLSVWLTALRMNLCTEPFSPHIHPLEVLFFIWHRGLSCLWSCKHNYMHYTILSIIFLVNDWV